MFFGVTLLTWQVNISLTYYMLLLLYILVCVHFPDSKTVLTMFLFCVLCSTILLPGNVGFKMTFLVQRQLFVEIMLLVGRTKALPQPPAVVLFVVSTNRCTTTLLQYHITYFHKHRISDSRRASSRAMALGSTQPLRDMSTRIISWR